MVKKRGFMKFFLFIKIFAGTTPSAFGCHPSKEGNGFYVIILQFVDKRLIVTLDYSKKSVKNFL